MDDQLLIRFLTHRCREEELRQISRWIATDKSNADWLFEMEQIWSLKDELRFSDEQKISRAYNRFVSGMEAKPAMKPGKRVFISVMKYAAAAVIILLLSVNLYRMLEEEEVPLSMNIVEVPMGERASLTLSDGTKVWLNADTRFYYPSRFMSKKRGGREVMIDGEGYFEVAKDEKRPFVVKGDLFDISVLGTEFNVKAHKNEPAEISLKEGKIKVGTPGRDDPMILSPNDQIQVSTNGKTRLQQIDMSTVNSWTNGEIAFKDEPLSVIIKTLERKFNTPIVLVDRDLSDELFHCRTSSEKTLPEVLDLLKDTRRMNYRFENNKVLITKK
ncbi:MAG: FecR domain-containing protein [Tannerellaceae bacterium]|jgi:ferric-dicitrate binding protein FerR (iron transport regulator)|nr:FecR domain-containing protein [Tannerellaceae bacterium]